MTATLAPPMPQATPPAATPAAVTPSVHPLYPLLRPFSVDEYHRLLDAGILQSGEKTELLNGFLVRKMTVHPPHTFSLHATWQQIQAILPSGWTLRGQSPITLTASEPEPDIAVARGTLRTYATRHPGPADLGLVVEIADSSLDIDRTVKAPMYGTAGIPVYWIVDVVNRQVEVYTLGADGYGPPLVLTPGQMLPLVLDGHHVGDVPVADLFV